MPQIIHSCSIYQKVSHSSSNLPKQDFHVHSLSAFSRLHLYRQHPGHQRWSFTLMFRIGSPSPCGLSHQPLTSVLSWRPSPSYLGFSDGSLKVFSSWSGYLAMLKNSGRMKNTKTFSLIFRAFALIFSPKFSKRYQNWQGINVHLVTFIVDSSITVLARQIIQFTQQGFGLPHKMWYLQLARCVLWVIYLQFRMSNVNNLLAW